MTGLAPSPLSGWLGTGSATSRAMAPLLRRLREIFMTGPSGALR
jgi:hypothetical protein